MKIVAIGIGIVIAGVLVIADEIGKYCEDVNPYGPCDPGEEI